MRACLDRYSGLVWSLARRMSPSPAEAEDAVQEIFLTLWKNAGRFDATIASEPTFVAMVARRRLLDRRRAYGRRDWTTSMEGVDVASTGPGPDAGAEAALAARALATLRPEQREVLLLSVCAGLSHQEIAESKRIPLGTVKTHARRALMKIRALLGGRDDDATPVATEEEESP